jgi:hypothetical protein
MHRALAPLSIFLLAGCAGYAADYWKPKQSLIAAQLPRYGIAGGAARCVEAKLTASLSVWQLRQLADLAGRLTPRGGNPEALGPRELIYVAGLARDSKVGPETRRALDACNVGVSAAAPAQPPASPVTSAPPPAPVPVPPPPAPVTAPPSAAAAEPLWLNLGTAATGQSIAVDPTSVTRGPSWRQAWFRLLNRDQAGVGDIGYLLRIDCASRNIMAFAGRKYAPGGVLVEQKDYPKPEGPMAIEKGTVIELAFRGLCE